MSWSSESSVLSEEQRRRSKCTNRKIEIPIKKMIQDDLQEEDNSDPGTRLTGYVREHYLKHLIKLLMKNFESCSDEPRPARNIDREEVEQCAAEMEQKALRGSIVVKLYQRAIAQIAADIKSNTEQLKLHQELTNFMPFQKDQGSQTETIQVTEQESPVLPDTTQPPSDRPLPLHTHDLPSRSTYYNDLECDQLWPQEYWQSQQTEDSTIPIIVNFEPKVMADERQLSSTNSTPKELENNAPPYDSEVHNEILNTFVQAEDLNENKPIIEPEYNDNEMLSLDERVAMIHGEFEKPMEVEVRKNPKKKLVWRLEKLHYVKLLDSRLKLLSEAKRCKVERLFRKLFCVKRVRPTQSIKKPPLLETQNCSNINQLNRQKDKMAPWIIKHLMPYYTDGRIANKELFKSTAKYVSEALLDRSRDSEETDIQRCVDQLMSTM